MSDVTIKLDGKEYDLDDFELGDLEWLEEEMGASLAEMDANSMKAAVRFIYLIRRREDPSYTLEQARKEKVKVLADDGDAGDPPQTAAKGGAKAKAA